MSEINTPLLEEISIYCKNLESEFALIPNNRKKYLSALSLYFSDKFQRNETPQVTVICTHNSRRSHIGQIWLSVGAHYYGLPTIQTFSGGTEATAFNPRAVAALKKIGFDISQTKFESPTNPIYEVKWANNQAPYQAFSKKYNTPPNPSKAFGAIMVCTEADKGCPFVIGADFRLALPFDDPKAFDDTPLESEKYLERCQQIGRELLFAMSQVTA